MRFLLLAAVGAAFFPAQALAGTSTLAFQVGPIRMTPYEVTQQPVFPIPSPSEDGYVTSVSADVVDAAGNPEPQSHVMLHHIVFAKIGQPDSTCPGLPAQRFYAEGEERTQLQLPPGYGYPNKATDRWALLYMLMNHRNAAESIYVKYTVQYVTGEALTPVKPIWLDVRNCADSEFSVPGTGAAGSTFARPWDYRLPESGYLVAGGGHLHGGAISLALSDATCGSTLFTSYPTWGGPEPFPVMHEPGPRHMSSFSIAPGIAVAAGDTLRLTATYDDSRPHTRVMGIMMVFLASAPVSGCQAAPPLPLDPLGRPALSAPPVTVLPLLKQPAGKWKAVRSTWVGDNLFGVQRVTLRRGQTFTWSFVGAVAHNVTLATGPVGFASPSLTRGSWSYRFTRPGTYRLFCSWHPTQMTQIVRVR